MVTILKGNFHLSTSFRRYVGFQGGSFVYLVVLKLPRWKTFSAKCQIGLSSPPQKKRHENTSKFSSTALKKSCFGLSNSPSKNTKKDPPVSWNQSSACDTAMALVFPPQASGLQNTLMLEAVGWCKENPGVLWNPGCYCLRVLDNPSYTRYSAVSSLKHTIEISWNDWTCLNRHLGYFNHLTD